ncbi:hypothetical protein [Streptomyces sp. NPDC000229]|uniref:hypothetical protein n=1 Tax=Streptomyces sp. NPDC000229 TaxID=3154247 RepID=UPI00331CA1C3
MKRRRLGAVAVALCLGGALTACGNGAGEGRVATGPAGRPGGSGPVPPSGEVVLVPLDGRGPSGTGTGAPSMPPVPSSPSSAAGPSGSPPPAPAAPAPTRPTPSGSSRPAAPPPQFAPPSQTQPQPQPPQEPAPGTPPPPRPAALTVGEPLRAPTNRRWCEKVTVQFRNTGGSPVRSGTTTFATHIIGALGVDWATVESAQPLPAPIEAGATRTETYTVCVDAWRVPLGMRIETQDVTASWG